MCLEECSHLWCLSLSFLIRHISAHESLVENPKHRAALLCNPAAGVASCHLLPRSSPLTDHFGTALLWHETYLLQRQHFTFWSLFFSDYNFSTDTPVTSAQDLCWSCYLPFGIMLFLCWRCVLCVVALLLWPWSLVFWRLPDATSPHSQ